jgi:hypothetical protein
MLINRQMRVRIRTVRSAAESFGPFGKNVFHNFCSASEKNQLFPQIHGEIYGVKAAYGINEMARSG